MDRILSAEEVSDFRRTVYQNYHEAGRDFPWRNTVNPYEILVSEMMLQQTQTLRVVPKYEVWLNRFPSAADVASAPLSEILQYWSGLGYNRRAVFLQKACTVVCKLYSGIFPQSPDELEKLPGIGPYTARAVAAFAFSRPEVFVETNIRSVFIFFFFKNSTEKVSDTDILPLVSRTLDKEHPREWYYALMDYGAELKRHIVNPNRRSREYSRQSAFEGSLRQARGAILRQLVQNGKMSLEEIAQAEHIDMDRLQQASDKLLREGLITVHGSTFQVTS